MSEKYAVLRRLAEAATPGRVYDRLPEAGGGIKYHCFGDDGSVVLQVDHKNGEFGFIGPRGEQDEAFFLKCTPATILALLDQLAAAEKDAQRLDWMLQEQCIIRAQNGTGMPTVFSLWWSTLSEGQRYWYATERDAIDAAMQEQKP